ncbi:hypothetical protein D3C80_1111770 [compost metagenome]
MLAGGQGGEGLTPVGDISDDPGQLDRSPRTRADQASAQLQPAIAVAHLILGVIVAVAVDGPRQGGGAARQVFGLELADEVARGEGLAVSQVEEFPGATGQPQGLGGQGQLPIADAAGVDDGDQLVTLIHHGDGKRQKQDEDGHARDPDGQHQGRCSGRTQRDGGLERRHRQGRHGHMVHPHHGHPQDQGRCQSPQRRPVLLDGEQGGDGSEEGDRRRQHDQAGRIGQARRRPQRRHADIVHGADADPHDQTGQNHASAVGAARAASGDQKGEAGPRDSQQERDGGQQQVITNRRAGIEAQHGDEVHRPDAAAHGHARRGQPAQTCAALVRPHLLEQIQRRPGREDGDQKRQTVEDGKQV